MTNNGQTPGGNTTTAGAVEQLARAAADLNVATDGMEQLRPQRQAVLDALAAIIETQERDAALAEFEGGGDVLGLYIAKAIRSGKPLKGPKP